MKKKTLIVITENYVPGGANKYTEDLIYCLKDNFERIEIWGNGMALKSLNKARLPTNISFKKIKIFNTGELVKNVPKILQKISKLVFIPFFFLLNLLSLLILKIKISKIKPELVILCNGGYPASLYLDLTASFLNSKNIFMTIVSTPIRSEKRVLAYFWKWIDYLVLTKCNRLIVNSTAIKNELVQNYHFPEQKIAVLRNGIFDQTISRTTNDDVIRIGFVSRIEKAKGIEELLVAYEKLRINYKNIILTIAGSGSLNKLVEKAAQKDSSIHFLGHMNSGINELLHKTDIYVLPSYQEGLPYSVIEACMAECAIVATNVGGIPEIIENEKSGLLVPAGNENALYLALEKLILNNSKRAILSKNARLFFISNLSMDKMQEQTRNIFL